MKFSARWAKLAAFVAAFTLIIPTVMTAGVAAQDGGKTLRIHHTTYPDVVDPQKSSYTNEIDILGLIYEGLTKLDTNQETVPGAAESWEYNEDGTSLTFKLRPDLKYSDGSALTAENFRYAVERTCSPVTAGEYQSILFEIVGCAEFSEIGTDEAAPVDYSTCATGEAAEGGEVDCAPYEEAIAALGAKAIDDTTFELTFTQAAPYFHTIGSTWVFYPVKEESVLAELENWWKSPENHIGNGPFRVTGIEEDQRWSFEANDNYYEGRPKMDAIEYIYVEDSAVALESFRNGDLDIVHLEPQQIDEVSNDSSISESLVVWPQGSTRTLDFNLSLEPWTDKKAREAFIYAFDRETFCAEIRSGDCVPTLSWIPAGSPGAIETDKYGFDPEAAQAALAESSYGSAENLPEIKLYFNSDLSGATERAEWVAGQYRDILGAQITLEPTDGTSLTALRKDPATFPHMLLVGGWIQDYPDPQNWLSVFWTCNSTFAQRVGYCNEELDRLTTLGDTTVDSEERIGYYEQAGQILVDDAPAGFLYNPASTFVVSPNVTGYTATPSEVEWPGSMSSLMTIDKTE
jgi:oligopeptide transport system substrate-binding protein